MTSSASSPGRFEPLHDAHAIDNVVFVLRFSAPVDEALWTHVLKEFETAFGKELPGRLEMQGFAFALGQIGPINAPSVGPSAGRVFRYVRPDGSVEREVNIERQAISFRTTAYTRWDEISAQATRFVAATLPKYVEKVSISALGLNFFDKFVWNGNMPDCRPLAVLRPRSNYICPHVYDAQDLWHSHTGVFLRVDQMTKRLLQVNADCVDESSSGGPRRVVAITTALTDMLNQPDFAPFATTADQIMNFFVRRIDELHNFSKQIFANLIDDHMCKRIALVD